MKKQLLAAVAAVGFVGALGFSSSSATAATCNTGPTPGAVVTPTVDGGVVYSDGTTYGTMGSHGYIEASPSHAQGSSTDVALEGRATATPSVCVNGNQLV